LDFGTHLHLTLHFFSRIQPLKVLMVLIEIDSMLPYPYNELVYIAVSCRAPNGRMQPTSPKPTVCFHLSIQLKITKPVVHFWLKAFALPQAFFANTDFMEERNE